MRRKIEIFLMSLVFLAAVSGTAGANVWMVPSVDILPAGSSTLGLESYFTLGSGSALTATILSTGLLREGSLKADLGVSLYEPSDTPLAFRGRIGLPEGALGESSPALAVGGYDFGLAGGVNDFNVVYALAARTWEGFGRVKLGWYSGNADLLGPDNQGLLLGWDRPLTETLWLGLDYTGGDNAYGAVSGGLGFSLAKNAMLTAGYVSFNNGTGGQALTQLNIGF